MIIKGHAILLVAVQSEDSEPQLARPPSFTLRNRAYAPQISLFLASAIYFVYMMALIYQSGILKMLAYHSNFLQYFLLRT